jgi:hypothetical protein
MMTATYSPEDNKLRLYAVGRLGDDTYARVKAAGFKWAPRQELFVAPAWTPAREDLLLDLCGEIDDEDYSPEERSADRAERFSGYRDKRADEAGDSADRFDAGPAAFGHQSQARAERLATRHDRHRTYATSQWSKAEYWQDRTRAVISHALFKSDPRTRRGRLLRLESEQRRHEDGRKQYAARFAAWSKVGDRDGADTLIGTPTPAGKLAYALANLGSSGWDYKHPRTGKESSLYSHLTDTVDPITPREAAVIWLQGKPDPGDEDTRDARWSRHYSMRIDYEKAMLAEEGGLAGDLEMEPGGWIGSRQIQKVNKSPKTGRIVSVEVWGTTTGYTKESDYRIQETRPTLVLLKVERMGEDAYRPPTDEERAAFQTETAERKAQEKAGKPKAPPLVNPTDEDAEKLQAAWNEANKAKYDGKRNSWDREYKPTPVLRMTQAQYAAVSKGTYARCETRMLHACGKVARKSSNLWSSEGAAYDKSLGAPVCKLRIGPSVDYSTSPPAIIVLTDKPKNPIPWPTPAPAIETTEERFTLEPTR